VNESVPVPMPDVYQDSVPLMYDNPFPSLYAQMMVGFGTPEPDARFENVAVRVYAVS
jgi:hypothetical protein